MNRLSYSRCYLCGAMDRATDGGVGWRRDIRDTLEDLRIMWLDPTRKPIQMGVEDDASRARRKFHKTEGVFHQVAHEMKSIRGVDIRMVNICDFLVVNLDLDVHACGTYEELFLANSQEKPIFVRAKQGKSEAPDWLYGAIPHNYIHSTWDDLYTHIRYVATNPKFIDPTGRWFFFDWMGKELN